MVNKPESRVFLDKFLLPGKVALVTGGSRGIGKAIALGLAEAGADIILASRKLPDLEATAHEISQMGRRALAVPANLRYLPEIESLVKKSIDEFGRVDILVNNAGTNIAFGTSVFDIDERIWEIMIELNLKGYFFLSQAVGRIMREQSSGTIINTASIRGLMPTVGSGIYAITKAGVIMLTQVLAEEWGQYNIRVNAIAPGMIKTKLTEPVWTDSVRTKEFDDNTALGRFGEPEEMVNAVIFLASEASSYMTGQTLVLDGGQYPSVRRDVSRLRVKERTAL